MLVGYILGEGGHVVHDVQVHARRVGGSGGVRNTKSGIVYCLLEHKRANLYDVSLPRDVITLFFSSHNNL